MGKYVFEKFLRLVERAGGFTVLQYSGLDVESIRRVYNCIIDKKPSTLAEMELLCGISQRDFYRTYISLSHFVEKNKNREEKRHMTRKSTSASPSVVEQADNLLTSLLSEFGIGVDWYIAFVGNFVKAGLPILVKELGEMALDLSKMRPEDAAAKVAERLKMAVELARREKELLDKIARLEQERDELASAVQTLKAEVEVRDRLLEYAMAEFANIYEQMMSQVVEVMKTVRGRKALEYLLKSVT